MQEIELRRGGQHARKIAVLIVAGNVNLNLVRVVPGRVRTLTVNRQVITSTS